MNTISEFDQKQANEMMLKEYVCKNDPSVTAVITSIMFYEGAHPHYPCTLHQGWTVNYITNKCYLNSRLSPVDFLREYSTNKKEK